MVCFFNHIVSKIGWAQRSSPIQPKITALRRNRNKYLENRNMIFYLSKQSIRSIWPSRKVWTQRYTARVLFPVATPASLACPPLPTHRPHPAYALSLFPWGLYTALSLLTSWKCSVMHTALCFFKKKIYVHWNLYYILTTVLNIQT